MFSTLIDHLLHLRGQLVEAPAAASRLLLHPCGFTPSSYIGSLAVLSSGTPTRFIVEWCTASTIHILSVLLFCSSLINDGNRL